MNEKQEEYLLDMVGGEDKMSDCCSAQIYVLGDYYICKDCKEPCDIK